MASQRRHIPLSPSVRRAQPITHSLGAGTNGKGESQKVPKPYRKMSPRGSCKDVPKGSQRGARGVNMVFKGRQMDAKWAQRVPTRTKSEQEGCQKGAKRRPKWTQRSIRASRSILGAQNCVFWSHVASIFWSKIHQKSIKQKM